MSLTRRQALARIGAGAAALTAAGGLTEGCSLLGGRPNVVFIIADDLGSVDLGSYGSPDLITPHLDALARQGVRFSQFYVTAPACTPSRASMLTGRQFPRALISGGMNPAEVTVGEMLRSVGYRTACIGKWHLGFKDGMYAKDQGFDEFFGHRTGCLDNYSHYYYWGGADRHVLYRGDEPWYEEGAYYPDLVVREALRFIDEPSDDPFLLLLPLNMPHYPIQPDPAWRQRYAHISNPARREYAAFVSTMDERIGRILTHIEELGKRDDTIVIFVSDHGHSTEERSGGGGSAGILRGGKMTLWEGGIRVPCLISWPAQLPAGQLRTQPASTLDLLPTLADFCDAPRPDVIIDGRSLAGVCASANAHTTHDTMHWVYEQQWAVREGPWKLVGHDDEWFLANLAMDPGEHVDQKTSHPEVLDRLQELHNNWVLEMRQDPNIAAELPSDPQSPDGLP